MIFNGEHQLREMKNQESKQPQGWPGQSAVHPFAYSLVSSEVKTKERGKKKPAARSLDEHRR